MKLKIITKNEQEYNLIAESIEYSNVYAIPYSTYLILTNVIESDETKHEKLAINLENLLTLKISS
jgi:hypothetical protein